jgi:hypothetical protein
VFIVGCLSPRKSNPKKWGCVPTVELSHFAVTTIWRLWPETEDLATKLGAEQEQEHEKLPQLRRSLTDPTVGEENARCKCKVLLPIATVNVRYSNFLLRSTPYSSILNKAV